MKWTAVIALALCVSCAWAAGAAPLRSEISVEGESSVRFEIFADGEDVSFLSWGTPLEEAFQERFLSISAAAAENHGQWTALAAVVKRAQPSEEHFVTIAAGSSVSGSIAVGDHYAIHEAGAYLLRLEFPVVLRDGSRAVSISNEVVLEVREAAERPVRVARSVETVFYTGCSSSETSQIQQAIVDAESATEDALAYLDANGSCIDDYVDWFGVYSSSRFSTVEGAYESILAQFESTDFGFDCTCTDPNTYAFVFIADTTQTIHLCGAFWVAASGRGNIDSQPGTLVHEMSHFTAIYGSEDTAYGVADCSALASQSPSLAINNADSLEYFTESNPVCSSSCGDNVCTGVEAQACANDCDESDSVDTNSLSPDTDSVSPNTDSVSPNTDSVSPNTNSASPNTNSGNSNSGNSSNDDDDDGNNDNSGASALAGSAVAAVAASLLMAM